MTKADPQNALGRVAAQNAGSVRELEELAASIVQALVSDWQPEAENLQGEEAARAGYLIQLAVTTWATHRQAHVQPLLDELARRRGVLGPRVTFYPGQPPLHNHDELASSWGLASGAYPAELRRVVDQDLLSTNLPCFLDFEASSLSIPDSYPIEAGWSLPNGTVEAYLINPDHADNWTDWDPVAEHQIHGLSRTELRKDGYSPRWVAQRMNDRLAGREVYCDGGDHDWHWLARLYQASGLRPAFSLGSIAELRNELASQLAAPRGLYYETGFDLIQHRAGDDVRRHLMMYQALLRVSRGEAPFDG